MLKSVLRLFKTYQNAKEEAVEETVNYFEADINSIYFVVFLAASLYEWYFAIFQAEGLARLYDLFGFYPISVFFITSYFLFFLGSKLLFKPTEEELSDDTSTFAIFSACSHRSRRSIFSICFSVFYALIFVLYLVSKDLK
jgi:hypothetical protein